MKTEFSKCLENIFTWNAKAEKFTFISFCAAEQLSVFIHELKKNLGILTTVTKKNTILYTGVA